MIRFIDQIKVRFGVKAICRVLRPAVRGVRRSKTVFTTKPDPAVCRPTDLVQRPFTTDGPRRLWVCDVTYARDVVRVRVRRVHH